MLVALSATATLDERLSLVAWTGVTGICVGVLVLGLSRHAFDNRRAVYFALANAVVIAIYTVVDGLGARAALAGGGNAVQYVVLLFVLDGWPFALLVLARRGRDGRARVWAYARSRWIHATGGALASLGSYGIALWAMTQAPVAMVAALREVSVLFAAVLGVVFLKEAVTLHRVVGTFAIVAGVLALRLG